MYSTKVGAFADADEQIAAQFAPQAAVVLVNAAVYWDAHALTLRLQESMEFRSVIEQAKGILMAAQRCTPDEAFDLLVAASQRENVKLRDIARRIVDRTASTQPTHPEDTGPT